MNTITAQIAKQSKIILVFAKVTRILLSVLIVLTAFLLVSTFISAEEPVLQIGNTKVYLTVPVQTLLGIGGGAGVWEEIAGLRAELAGQLAAFILSQIMLHKITKLFTIISENKDPFTADVARPMKAFAVALGLIIAIQNTILGVVVALTVFAFALIFQYGAQLQNQADETL